MSAPPPLVAAGRVAGAAALIAVLTVASRLAGFGRTAVFTWVVGPTDLGGAYLVANTVPNIIFEVVAGGALASLVVPLLAGAVAAGDRREVAATTGALLTWTVSLLVPLAVVVALAAGPLIGVVGEGLTEAQQHTGKRMLWVFAPQLPLYGVGIVLTGVLQAHRRFAWPVIAPLLSSLTVITAYLTFGWLAGRLPGIGDVALAGELVLTGGTTLGVVVLSLSLLVPLRRLGLRPRLGYAFTPGARARVGALAVAGAVTVAAQQVALLVLLNQVTFGPTFAPTVFNLAQTVYLLPWAVLAVPLAVAAYPTLAAVADDPDAYRRTLAPTVRGVLLLSCLGAAALVGTARPVAAFFFDPPVAAPAAAAIAGFAPGLLGYGLFAVLSRALYARGDIRAATVVITLGWLAVPAAALPLAAVVPVGQRVLAVALANSLGMLLLGVVLLLAVARAAGRPALAGSARAGVTGLLAGSVAALAGAWLTHALAAAGDGTPTTSRAMLEGMLSGVVVGVVFLAVAYPADRRDVRPLLAGVLRRLGRRTRAGRPGPSRPERAPEDGKVSR